MTPSEISNTEPSTQISETIHVYRNQNKNKMTPPEIITYDVEENIVNVEIKNPSYIPALPTTHEIRMKKITPKMF